MISDDYLYSDIGIDSFGFHAPRYYLKVEDIALERKIDPNKYKKGLLLNEMRFPEIDEDIVSMGLKAAYNCLIKGNINPKEIDAIFLGTETMTYAVKSVSNIFAELLGISTNSMTQDVYNACAAGTLATVNAIALIEQEIINKALVISADISTYKLGSPSEPTQGSGATAFVIKRNPRVAVFSKKFGKVSGNVNDFYRPANEVNAKVFGSYSVDTYLTFQLKAYDDLIKNIGDFHADFYTFHAPFSKLPIKCMQQIIQKRWINHINFLPKINKNEIKSSLIRKIDNFFHDVTVLPEYIYLKLKEKGYSSEVLENLTNKLIKTIKGRVFPQLRVPMNFGNMYSAALWSQIIYILENYANKNDSIYFGSYGSGATCISGLLKVVPGFKSIVDTRPNIDDYIKFKERKSYKEYESIKSGNFEPKILLGRISEHDQNDNRGFTLYFCDEGCIIPHIKGLNYCPKGHPGLHKKTFPLFAVLDSEPKEYENYKGDCSYLTKDLVRISNNVKIGSPLEYEIRRVENKEETNPDAVGLLNWIPMYIPCEFIH